MATGDNGASGDDDVCEAETIQSNTIVQGFDSLGNDHLKRHEPRRATGDAFTIQRQRASHIS